MLQQLDVDVVVKDLENRDQMTWLLSLGFELFAGELFTPPRLVTGSTDAEGRCGVG